MPIKPQIPLAGRNPNFAQAFQQGVQNRRTNQLLQARQQAAQAEAEAAQEEKRQNQLAAVLAQAAAGGNEEAQNALLALDPERAQAIGEVTEGRRQQARQAEAAGAVTASQALEAGDVQTAQQTLQSLPESPLRDRALQALEQGDTQTAQRLTNIAVDRAQRLGLIEAPEQQRPVKLGAGSRLVDPRSGAVIAQGEQRRPTGRFERQTDQFGNAVIIDTMTGEIVSREQAGQAQQGRQAREQAARQAHQRESNLFDAIGVGTGPAASIQQGINNVIGPFVEGVPFEDTSRARAAIRNFNQDAKTALVNNPRFPVAEQEVVQRLLPDPSQFFQDPDAARGELQELRDFLINKREQNRRSINSGNITENEVGDLANQVEAINRVLGLMGSPRQNETSRNVIDFSELPE